ncbi:MAG: DUF4136 domain-containing protein [Chitinophagaceae bacterium]|nr:DUF4136 domain-containing protein [Chitinophagaceae bacterium]
MKKIKYLFMAVVAVLSITACTAPVNIEKDDAVNFEKYKSYMWVDTRYNQNDNSTRPSSYGDITVRNAANAELRKAGWREVTDNPDILVSYDVLVSNSTMRRSDPVYTQSYSRTYYNPRLRRWGTIYYPSQFVGYNNYDVPVKEGTITLTFTDAKTDKVVLQGWTTDAVDYERITTEEITAGVKNIFKKLDLTSK